MSSNQQIYEGFWTNWAKGRFLGVTLTLTRENGAYLTAFLALFVHISGASFWRLACFIIFRARSRPELDDEIALQQQRVLRNTQSATGALRNVLRIVLRSRNLRKSAWLLFLAGLNFVCFFLAGIFSSRVTSTTSDVLLKPTHCGRW